MKGNEGFEGGIRQHFPGRAGSRGMEQDQLVSGAFWNTGIRGVNVDEVLSRYRCCCPVNMSAEALRENIRWHGAELLIG